MEVVCLFDQPSCRGPARLPATSTHRPRTSSEAADRAGVGLGRRPLWRGDDDTADWRRRALGRWPTCLLGGRLRVAMAGEAHVDGIRNAGVVGGSGYRRPAPGWGPPGHRPAPTPWRKCLQPPLLPTRRRRTTQRSGVSTRTGAGGHRVPPAVVYISRPPVGRAAGEALEGAVAYEGTGPNNVSRFLVGEFGRMVGAQPDPSRPAFLEPPDSAPSAAGARVARCCLRRGRSPAPRRGRSWWDRHRCVGRRVTVRLVREGSRLPGYLEPTL